MKRATVVTNILTGGAASNLDNQGASLTVGGSILSAAGTTAQCAGAITSLGYNLRNGPACTGLTGSTGNPELGSLRDNGGATLTYAIPADSPAIDEGFLIGSADCDNRADQRGRPRPYDVAQRPRQGLRRRRLRIRPADPDR